MPDKSSKNKYGLDFSVRVNTGKSGGPGSGSSGGSGSTPQKDPPPPSKKPVTGIDDSPPKPKEPPPKEIRFTGATARPHPVHGFEINKPFLLDVTAEYIRKTVRKKISVSTMIPVIDGKAGEDLRPAREGFLDDSGKVTLEVPMFIPSDYPGQPNGVLTHPISYRLTVESAVQESSLTVDLSFSPSDSKPAPVLRRGMYDDRGVEKYPSKCPKGGKEYVEGTPVEELQKILARLRYLKDGGADGVFGEGTETAVKAFQRDAATSKQRLHQQRYQKEEAHRLTYDSDIDGVVGPKSRNELDLWLRNGWIRPIIEIRPGEYDQKAVDEKLKPRGGDDYHPGTVVVDRQKEMQKIGVYSSCKLDGWFGEKMKAAVESFQQYAEKGKFLINGVLADIGKKLTGARKGVLDLPTQEMLAEVVEKGGKVPEETDSYGGFELQQGDNDSARKWAGKVCAGNGRWVRQMQEDLVKLGYWVSNANSGSGMVCDGDFGLMTKGALTTFQKEHGFKETGSLTKETTRKIKALLQMLPYTRPLHKAGNYGDFMQLPSSANYSRYFADYDEKGVMDDIWGTKTTIEMIGKTAEIWVQKKNNPLAIGDISKYNGGKFPPHSTHQDGTGVDCGSPACCAINKKGFLKDKSLELAGIFKANGATRILFNCKYVADHCDIVYGCAGHDNHSHIDTKATVEPRNHESFFCKGCAVYENCDYKRETQR